METSSLFLPSAWTIAPRNCVWDFDPHPSDLPAPTAEAARNFCLNIIKATAPYAAAFKPNAAFFELYDRKAGPRMERCHCRRTAEVDRMVR